MMRLTMERWKKGWSMAELARRCGANASSISRIERRKEPPYPLRAQRIAKAVGWQDDVSLLFEEVDGDDDQAA